MAEATTCTRPGSCGIEHRTCNGYPRVDCDNAGFLLNENWKFSRDIPDVVSRSYESCHTPQGDRCEPDAPESIAARAQQDKEREAAAPPLPYSTAAGGPGGFTGLAMRINDARREERSVEDDGYDAVKARRARLAKTCAWPICSCRSEGGDRPATCEYEYTPAVSVGAVGDPSRRVHFNCRCEEPKDPIAEAVRKLEEDKAVEAAYASVTALPGPGRFAIARRAALAAVQAVRDLR